MPERVRRFVFRAQATAAQSAQVKARLKAAAATKGVAHAIIKLKPKRKVNPHE